MQRRPNQPWTRTLGLAPGTRRHAWAVLLVLALAFATLGHVTHAHAADSQSAVTHCAFCPTFERGSAPPPAGIDVAVARPAPVAVATRPYTPVVLADVRPACQPRAPPFLQA